ncbi:hypothetical protein FQR65_LT02171 [Abscondita terminalis]|nr:hypothetical protein FQR65_LT02171 [Abscondita terminalis]
MFVGWYRVCVCLIYLKLVSKHWSKLNCKMQSINLYKSLTMEIRPRIQSVNVYIILNQPSPVNVQLNSDSFDIQIGETKEKVDCEDFRINPQSLTCFLNTDKEVTFRFATENIQQKLGSACCELLVADMQSCSIATPKTKTFLANNTEYTISCSNCFEVLCSNVSFKRVLPLPDNSNPSEWFCHAQKDFVMKPKEDEVFFSECFAYFHPNILLGLVSNNSVLKCLKCNSWIGTVNNDGHKIWFSAIVFDCKGVKHVSNPLSDCLKMVLNEGGTLLRSTRLVLKCSDNQVLLLWILERKLKVHFITADSNFKEDVAKVLFKNEKI